MKWRSVINQSTASYRVLTDPKVHAPVCPSGMVRSSIKAGQLHDWGLHQFVPLWRQEVSIQPTPMMLEISWVISYETIRTKSWLWISFSDLVLVCIPWLEWARVQLPPPSHNHPLEQSTPITLSIFAFWNVFLNNWGKVGVCSQIMTPNYRLEWWVSRLEPSTHRS